MPLRKPSDRHIPYATILLVGDPGSYKTLLASTAPSAYILDADDGAAHTGVHGHYGFPIGAQGYDEILNEIKALSRLRPGSDGLLTHTLDSEKFRVGTVVIDTLDEVQSWAGAKAKPLSQRYGKFDSRMYYRLLKEYMKDLITAARQINAHLVFVAHTKTYLSDEDRKAKKLATVTLALEGRIRDEILGWVDVMLHLVNRQDGTRQLLTQPSVVDGRWLEAKDRYHLFQGKAYTVKFRGDKPDPAIMQTILDITTGGVKATHLAKERAAVKTAWVDEARRCGIIKGVAPTKEEGANLKVVLGNLYDEVATAEDLDALREAGLSKIRSAAEKSKEAQ